MSVITVTDEKDGGSITIRILREPLKIYGVPHQGSGFFTSYYPIFRGRGVMLNYSLGSNVSSTYGMFAAINTFFSASSVLYLGCEANGEHIEAGVFSPTVMALEAVCSTGALPSWGPTLARSLSQADTNIKNPSRFRIEFESTSTVVVLPRDRDLVVHHVDDLFPAAPTTQSSEALTKFLSVVHSASRRLCIGGFYVLAAPLEYSGIDLMLSSISATVSPDKPLVYVGIILYGKSDLLWIFRVEPMNPASLESQRTMALSRLTRYPPILQAAVDKMMPELTQVASGIDPSFEEALSVRVTPTDTLKSLFRLVTIYPREVLNRLANFQTKYSKVIDSARAISDLKIQTRIIVEFLYDLALAAQRKRSSSFLAPPSSPTRSPTPST